MMSTTDQANLAPIYVEDGPQTPLDAAQLGAARRGTYAAIPDGWQVASGYRMDVTVGFADPRDLPFPSGMTVGRDDLAGIKVLREGRVSLVSLFLDRGAERCQVEIAQLDDELARLWAESILATAKLSDTAAGRAGVGGPTAVLDRGSVLIRATYDRDRPAGATEADDNAQAQRVEDGALEFLREMVAGV